jgi:dimethylglycine oxidase
VLQTHLEAIPVTMLRVSYVGELGWEIYTEAGYGAALWDLLWTAGRGHQAIAAGRVAFNSLRMEKGYRAWGTDMTAEDRPDEAGLGFAVRMSKGDFIGKTALQDTVPRKMLRSIVFDTPDAVALGKEPVFAGGACVGFVTSAGHSPTLGRTVAYAWLPTDTAIGDTVSVDHRGRRHTATVHPQTVVDPELARIRR